MTTLATYTPEAATAIRNVAVTQLRRALKHAVTTFEATPEEKLDYKPSETANSPRELIQHLLVGNGHLNGAFGVGGSPDEGPSDRKALIARLQSSTEAIIDKIETLPDAAMDTTVAFGPGMPMPNFLMAASWHLARHAGQLDYIQTIWGDLEDHM